MATTKPDLWPDSIKVEVLPPIAILKAQEGQLARRTQGMLQAKLTTIETEKLVQHQLDLIAPSLNFYRERLLSARHDREMLYPVMVTADAFAPKGALTGGVNQREAATDDDFIRLVREVLHSSQVLALIHSLLARINANGEPATNDLTGQDAGQAT